jgi:DNA (cytosine-5)-methyltransferase 1
MVAGSMAKRTKTLRVADFFCGAGGFSEGFRQMGFDIVFALDNWGPAIRTHELNHPGCTHSQTDILSLDTPEKIDAIVPDTEIIIGSPPCVAFSGSNKAGKADKTLGLKLIEAYLRIVAHKKSKKGSILKYWILENVPLSESHIKDEYTFKELGLPGKGMLKVPVRGVLNAADYGAPQTRTRFFGGDYQTPDKTHDEKDWVKISQVMACLKNPLDAARRKRVKDPCYGFDIETVDLTDHFYDTTVEEFEWRNALKMKRDHGFMGKMSFPEDTSRPSRTVMATRSASTREAMIYGGRVVDGKYISYRMPTIREIASLMSFPITYQFDGSNESQKYKLVGNAVCPKMAAALAKAILEREGLRPPKTFIPLPDVRPKLDLTGTAYKKKEPSQRRPDARFSSHIPYLKANGFRVDLSNLASNFEDGKIVWSCILHSGTGKGAKWYEVEQKRLSHILTTRFVDGFEDFEKDMVQTFKGRLPDAATFQSIFCRRSKSKKLGPEEALEDMARLVEKHFPEVRHKDTIISASGPPLGISRDGMPLRILVGIYVCNFVVCKING